MTLNARVATARDLDTVTGIIALAFAEDPVWRRFVAQPQGQTGDPADFLRPFILGALRYPWVWLWNDGEAASVWIPPGEGLIDRIAL